MPPTIVQQPQPTAAPAASAPVSTTTTPTTVTIAPAEVKESVLKRAATVPTNSAGTALPPTGNEPPKVAISIEDIKDPIARQILEKKLEEANKGISEAFGKVGAEKSKYLQEIEKLKAETNRGWTPERLQQEINKQDFMQSATTLQNSLAPQGVQQDTWSSWSQEEKQAFQNQQRETQMLRAELQSMQQSQTLTAVDIELKQEYPDFDSVKVNQFYQKAQQNQLSPREMREAVYWATNGKALVERAYELGKSDKTTINQERVNGISPNGVNMTPTVGNTVERKPGERSGNAFARHGHGVLDMLRAMPKRT